MESKKTWRLLYLFGETAEGEATSVPAPQTVSGEEMASSDPAAGERDRTGERSKAFRALMEGEYKDLFTAYFQETFNRRFKEQKEIREELQRARGTLDGLCEALGVSCDGLLAAVHALQAPVQQPLSEEAASEQRSANAREIQQAVERAVEIAQRETEQRLMDGIRARGLRPAEGALGDAVGNVLRGRANGLSREQRAEMARRAARGESVKL